MSNQDVVVLKDSKEDDNSLEVESGQILHNLTPAAQAVTDLIESQTLRELQLVQQIEFNPAEDHAILTTSIHKLYSTAMRLLDADYPAIYAERVRQHELAAAELIRPDFDKDNPELQNLPINLPPLEDESKFLISRETNRAKAVYALFKLLKDYIVERRKLSGQLYGPAASQGRQLSTTMSYKKAKLTGKQLLAQLPSSQASSIVSEPERIVNNVFNLNAPDRSAKPAPAKAKQEDDRPERISDYYQDDF